MDFFPLNGRVYGLFADVEGDGAEQAIRRVGEEDGELEIQALEDAEFEDVLAHFRGRDPSSSINALRQEERVISVHDNRGVEHDFRMIDAICLEGGVYGLLLRLGDGAGGR